MENAEEILQCLDEFSKLKPKDIPRELEDYLCFVAKTGDPVYQWPLIKCLFREKLISVITEFYEACPSVEIPPCPNVDAFNYDAMKNFILEKLDTFAAAPFTVQRICELLTSPRKEYNRIDKYMRALEKNILVVSTREPGNRKSTENGESIVNGLESEHVSQEIINSDINVEVEMDETAVWPKTEPSVPYSSATTETNIIMESQQSVQKTDTVQDTYVSESKPTESISTCISTIETVITSRPAGYIGYTPNITDLIIEPTTAKPEPVESPPSSTETVTITVTEPHEHEPQQPQPVEDNTAVFSMNTEPIIPTESSSSSTDDQTYTEQAEPVFVKASCIETAYSSVIKLEPEPSIVQNETVPPDTKAETSPIPTILTEVASCDSPIEPETTVVAPVVTSSSSLSEQIVKKEAESSDQSEPKPSQIQQKPEQSTTTSTTTITVEQTTTTTVVTGQTNSNETVISSTDEMTGDSSSEQQIAVLVSPEVTPLVLETVTPENEVSESNCAVSQTSSTTNDGCQTEIVTSTPCVEAVAVSESSDEQMEVDDPCTQAQATESTTQPTDSDN